MILSQQRCEHSLAPARTFLYTGCYIGISPIRYSSRFQGGPATPLTIKSLSRRRLTPTSLTWSQQSLSSFPRHFLRSIGKGEAFLEECDDHRCPRRTAHLFPSESSFSFSIQRSLSKVPYPSGKTCMPSSGPMSCMLHWPILGFEQPASARSDSAA